MMPKFEFLLSTEGSITCWIEAPDIQVAMRKFHLGEWETGKDNLNYRIEEIDGKSPPTLDDDETD